MVVGDDFVICLPPKCGTTYTVKHLVDRGPCRLSGRHRPRSEQPPELLRGKKVYTLVRDPWDWYCSFWAYHSGLKSASAWYNPLVWYTNSRQALPMIRAVCEFPEDLRIPKLDRPVPARCRRLGIGLATHRQLLACSPTDWIGEGRLEWPEDVTPIHQSNLQQGLQRLCDEHGIDVELTPNREKVSQRHRNPSEVIGTELDGLICFRDRLLARQFGYRPIRDR